MMMVFYFLGALFPLAHGFDVEAAGDAEPRQLKKAVNTGTVGVGNRIGDTHKGTNQSEDLRICDPGGPRGAVFPLPGHPEAHMDDRFKVMLYGFGLVYCFIGVSIVADMFMAAIEGITSRKRRVKMPGSGRLVTVQVWNETVSNLTLMALGSSAPEILLAINDIFKSQFFEGDLGPSTIVGSAAFNLFVIIAVCINAVPAGETRKIKEEGVFFITAVFSVLAYVWLLYIVQFNTANVIDVWEGVATFMFFPVLVWISWASDVGLLDQWFASLFPAKELNEDEERKRLESGEMNQFNARYARMRGLEKDPTEDDNARNQEDQEDPLLALCKGLFSMLFKCFGAICTVFVSYACYSCIWARRKYKRWRHKAGAGENAEEESEEKEDKLDMEDPTYVICDDEGDPIDAPAGVISFKNDVMEVMGELEEKEYTVPVLRKNGTDGRVSCKYRMERLTATPGYDYVEEDGVVDFKDGITSAEIKITILPKEVGEKSDQFQIILEEPTNEAVFNPNDDGGEECCLLTVIILNANPAPNNLKNRIFGVLDGLVNMDEFRMGTAAWHDQITEAFYCNGSPEAQETATTGDWIGHFIFFPWSMAYAILTPPPIYMGGWVCFVASLLHIGILTSLVGDLAELFGCAAGIEDNITAISVVALGTSVPDLFASKTAATTDEWADASIVNVTGSNSVNVFLGIGLPWMMAAIHWTIHGPNEEWFNRYSADFGTQCPDGCFVVQSGDLAFSVLVFTVGAIVCLFVIRLRRVVYDGELGGPEGSDSKACSSCLLVLLWIFYIVLSVWKTKSKADGGLEQMMAILIVIPIIIVLMMWFGVMLQLLRISKEYIGEEGFVGISVAVTVVALRFLYFIIFQ